jgi:hypothetical protein
MCGFEIDSRGCGGTTHARTTVPEHEDKTYKVEVKARDGGFPKWLEKSFEQGDISVGGSAAGPGEGGTSFAD